MWFSPILVASQGDKLHGKKTSKFLSRPSKKKKRKLSLSTFKTMAKELRQGATWLRCKVDQNDSSLVDSVMFCLSEV